MDGSKKIIKAENLEKMGTKVESVDIGTRKFYAKVFKDVPVDEQSVEMEEAVPIEPDTAEPDTAGPDTAGPEAAGPEEDQQEEQVKLERFHNEEGELIGLRITCKCGEVIDLEFTRD